MVSLDLWKNTHTLTNFPVCNYIPHTARLISKSFPLTSSPQNPKLGFYAITQQGKKVLNSLPTPTPERENEANIRKLPVDISRPNKKLAAQKLVILGNIEVICLSLEGKGGELSKKEQGLDYVEKLLHSQP